MLINTGVPKTNYFARASNLVIIITFEPPPAQRNAYYLLGFSFGLGSVSAGWNAIAMIRSFWASIFYRSKIRSYDTLFLFVEKWKLEQYNTKIKNENHKILLGSVCFQCNITRRKWSQHEIRFSLCILHQNIEVLDEKSLFFFSKVSDHLKISNKKWNPSSVHYSTSVVVYNNYFEEHNQTSK